MKERVAIYLSGVHNLKGGGGVERFFADFFDIYTEYSQSKYDLYFYSDHSTLKALKEVNKLKNNHSRVVILKNVSNRFKKNIENWDFNRKLKKNKIDILHCANYGRHDFDRIRHIAELPKRPSIILNIVDCQVPYVIQDENHNLNNAYKERYIFQPNIIKFDGVFSWYELFIEYFNQNNLYKFDTQMQSITSRFANTSLYKPSINKKNIIVFASRLHEQKKPDWLIKAIEILVAQNHTEINNWSFHIYGEGPMEEELLQMVKKNKLDNYIKFHKEGDLSKVFPDTKIYISTQDYENFPSLSMMEAMASGNIIIARNVGQTNLMVKNGKNGFILEEDNPDGLAKCILKTISLSNSELEEMKNESLLMINEIHTPKNFIEQIEDFWSKIINNKTKENIQK